MHTKLLRTHRSYPHTSFPPYSHWNSPLPPLVTVWLGKENFRSSGPLKIKVRNLPTCNFFLRDESCPCVSLRILSSPGHMQRPHFIRTSIALFSFFMRKHLHFLLPSEGEAKNSFFSPPSTFPLVLLLAAGFFGGPGGFGGGGPGNL